MPVQTKPQLRGGAGAPTFFSYASSLRRRVSKYSGLPTPERLFGLFDAQDLIALHILQFLNGA